jgi:hypothetical protein
MWVRGGCRVEVGWMSTWYRIGGIAESLWQLRQAAVRPAPYRSGLLSPFGGNATETSARRASSGGAAAALEPRSQLRERSLRDLALLVRSQHHEHLAAVEREA